LSQKGRGNGVLFSLQILIFHTLKKKTESCNLTIKKIISPAGSQWLTIIILATYGGRNQEDCGSKPVQANGSQDPISKISNTHTQK
jgi:hypothetical protein